MLFSKINPSGVTKEVVTSFAKAKSLTDNYRKSGCKNILEM